MPNQYVATRLATIKKVLIQCCEGSSEFSSAFKGHERETFIDLFLRNVIAPPFRIGSGQATDLDGNLSGALDIVVEYSISLSFPLLEYGAPRLYLAEGICAVIEVKSDLVGQWSEVLSTKKQLATLSRNMDTRWAVEPYPPNHVPLFAVGYRGWKTVEKVDEKLKEGKIDGVLVIESEIYRSGPLFRGHNMKGSKAMGGLLVSIEQLTSSMIGGKPPYLKYVK